MAKKITESLVDDIDGGPAEHTVRFTVDSYAYEIDLTGKHREELYDALEPFIRNGRQVRAEAAKNGGGKQRKPRTAKTDPEQLAAVRAWARGQGMQVSDRGRLPASVLNAYEEAHKP